MSTNKTQNYQLHTWTAEDEERLAEINENFAKLDGAIKSAKDKIQIVVGSYIGDGTGYRFIDLGATPRAILVTEKRYSAQACYNMAIEGIADNELEITEGGITVTGSLNYNGKSSDGAHRNPYRYIALFWSE